MYRLWQVGQIINEDTMIEMKVAGMTCGGCANSVKRAITREFPNASVDVELASGVVRIEGEVEPARVEASIRSAGYEVARSSP